MIRIEYPYNNNDNLIRHYSDENYMLLQIETGYEYQEAIDIADRLCLTCIDDTPAAADTFFPSFDFSAWKETFREDHDTDEKHSVPFTFIDLERIDS